MRFIGNKELITNQIEKVLKQKNLINNNYVFLDAFCGTGAVADYFKNTFNIVINDMIKWSIIYTEGRIASSTCTYSKLGFDPFHFFNTSEEIIVGFFYKNYSPGGSDRMYFTSENAGKIDFIRQTIESWKTENLISANEYSHLLASLIESISTVSNTAGVYGAFLKHWDTRALKKLILNPVNASKKPHHSFHSYNDKIENIIETISCDILYLDPPYTQNQYGTQYHLLQTLVLNDSPNLSKITGSRPTNTMRSDWSKEIESHILFDKIIARTKAKHIIFSYSKDGFLSKSFIESCLKRYGKSSTYLFKEISHKKYTNTKSKNSKDHFEYLFYIEKKEASQVVYESPLNYIGSKAKIIEQIKQYFPVQFNRFIDLFGGGFNVGINSRNTDIVYNDNNIFVKDLIESFNNYDAVEYVYFVRKLIKNYNLRPKDSYGYLKLRNFYNSLPASNKDPRMLFTIIMYGFNQQIRFNNSYEFNNPIGMRWFNDKVLEKMISFSRIIKERNVLYQNTDFTGLTHLMDKDCFVYLDPPYKLTLGSYNDGKRGFYEWNDSTELKLLSYLDLLHKNGIRFMLSYVLEHRGIVNVQILNWLASTSYKLIELETQDGDKRKEVIILNY